jgi:hypothetical protein
MLLLEMTLVLNAGFAVWLMTTFKPLEVTQ